MSKSQALTVMVTADLAGALEEMSALTGQRPTSLVERAVREYLDRNWRPPASRDLRGGTSSYIELTAREELLDVI